MAGGVLDRLRELSRQYYPTTAALEVTSRCNARCDYCCVVGPPSPGELNTADIYRAIDKICEAGVVALLITGGEPFVRSDILEILDHCLSKDFFKLSLYTNGIMLSEEHIRFLIDHCARVIPVRMSVFSHVAERNDSYFGVPGALERILQNSKRLIDGGVRVGAIVNAQEFNVDTLDETVAFLESRGFAFVGVGHYKIAMGGERSVSIAAASSQEFMERLLMSLPATQREALTATVRDRLNLAGSPMGLCRGLTDSISIDSGGGIHPCTGFRKFTIGNTLDDRTIREALMASREYAFVRSLDKNDLRCATCEFRGLCSPCLGAMHDEFGGFDKPNDFSCNYARALYHMVCEEE